MPEVLAPKSFSQLYLIPAQPVQDSARARVRLCALYKRTGVNDGAIAKLIEENCGVLVGRFEGQRTTRYYFDDFFNKASFRDLLDTITFIHENISGQSSFYLSKLEWISGVNKIFRENGLPYEVNSIGEVHYYVDEEFSRNLNSTIRALSDTKFSAAEAALRDALAALDAAPVNTLEAVRRGFDCCENVFKIKFSESRLGSRELKSKIKPILDDVKSGPNLHASVQFMEAFCKWVDGMHNLRHSGNDASIAPPDEPLAIALVSSAATYTRWMLDLAKEA